MLPSQKLNEPIILLSFYPALQILDQTESGKSNMAASKPKILIFQLSDEIERKLQGPAFLLH